jgi:hypothetical protein
MEEDRGGSGEEGGGGGGVGVVWGWESEKMCTRSLRDPTPAGGGGAVVLQEEVGGVGIYRVRERDTRRWVG